MSDFEHAVMAQLKSSGQETARMRELVAAAAKINTAGLKGTRILTKGIPVPDWLRVSGIGDKAAITKLIDEVVGKTPHLGGVIVFPYGIPFPDIYHVDIDLGNVPHPGF